MLRVNHKEIKRLITQKRRTITDRQFFSSRIFAGHLEDMAAAQTRRYRVRRKVQVRTVWKPKDQSLACTDNCVIWINAGHRSITAKRSREERYELICGYFAHELGHVLYTDFLSPSMYKQYFESGRWYPELPRLNTRDERMNEADIRHYCKGNEQRTAMFLKLAFNVSNILEDGYIEGRMLERYPGVLGSNLSIMREDTFTNFPTLTQLIEGESEGGHIWMSLMSLFLSYAKFGELKYGDEPLTDERIQTVFSLLAELDAAVTDPSPKERWHVVNTIIVRCWAHIKDFLENCEKIADDGEATGGGNAAETVVKILASIKGISAEGSGDTEPTDESDVGAATTLCKAKRQATARIAAESNPPADESEDVGDEAKGKNDSGGEAGNETESDSADDGSEALEFEIPLDTQGSAPHAQDVSPEKDERVPFMQTDGVSSPSGGETTVDSEYDGSGYTNAAADIERLLENIAERTVHTDLENERSAELNNLAKHISYGDIHDGVDKTIHRIAEVSEEQKESFCSVAAPLLNISKQLQRSLKQQLQDRRNGGKQTGLLMGRRLNSHALSRNDGRVFYKNALPNNIPELAISLLVDESGSMCSEDRATYARAAAIILHDFCKALHIPVSVYGHSTGYKAIALYSYAEFETIDRDDCYRLMDISARDNNRDGAALRYVAEQLSKRHEDIRMLILISDGQPMDSGYSGTAAEEDLRGIKHEYVRKGILFVAAAIGSDKENIERIYGDSFMDITDLTKLPIALTNVVKRHIRV